MEMSKGNYHRFIPYGNSRLLSFHWHSGIYNCIHSVLDIAIIYMYVIYCTAALYTDSDTQPYTSKHMNYINEKI